jgi:pentatricopeptide repeat protein
MLPHSKSSALVPSRNALRVLRQLALAGTTVGGVCAVAACTYDVHRRIRIAETIIENKRLLHTTAPNYDATSAAKRLAVMVEAAEAGEFMGIESLKTSKRKAVSGPEELGSNTAEIGRDPYPKPKPMITLAKSLSIQKESWSDQAKLLPKQNMDKPSLARNNEILALEAIQAKHAQTEGKNPLETELRLLMNKDLEITAANLFLGATNKLEPISWQRRQLAYHIFTANCIKGNIFVARALFNRISKISVVSEGMWTTLMHLLAKEGHIDSVGDLYGRFCFKFAVPTHLLEVILRCLIESKRLEEAKHLFHLRFKNDHNCGLCGAYLDGLWRKTRSIELLNAEFVRILENLESLGRKPTEKLFNPMIKALIESGRSEKAEGLVQDMPTKYDVQPGSRAVGLIVYSRALKCEWNRVMDGLYAMHDAGFTKQKKEFALVFDRVFLEYYPAHTGKQTFDLLITCINEFEMVPDRVLHRHMIEAMIEKGTEEMLEAITWIANEREWNTGIDDEQIANILRSRRLAMTGSPIGLWRTMQAAKDRQASTSSSQRILGTSFEDWTVRGEKIAPIHNPAEDSFPEAVSDWVKSKDANSYVPLHERMVHQLNAGRPYDALEAYQQANNAGHVIKPLHLSLAVIASILSGPQGLDNARRMITSQWNYLKKVPTLRHRSRFTPWLPIFFQRVAQVDPRSVGRVGLIKMAIFEYYMICNNTPGLKVRHLCVTSTSQYLLRNGRSPELVVELLTAIYQSRWRISHGFDQVLLKLLLRAFAQLCNLKGVWWCIMTVLSRSEEIKSEFVAEAISQMSTLDNALANARGNTTQQLWTLHKALEVLQAKARGDAYWADLNVDHGWKKLRRSQLTRPKKKDPFLPTAPLKELIPKFDEEWELDLLLKRTQFNAAENKKWWAERNLSNCHTVEPEDPEYPIYHLQTWDRYYVPDMEPDIEPNMVSGMVPDMITYM